MELEWKSDFYSKDGFCVNKIKTGNWMYFNLFSWVNYRKWPFSLLLVGLDLKLGKHPVIKSTYSGISLVSWLEWEGKTVKDIYMRQDTMLTMTREVRLKDRTNDKAPGTLSSTAKIHIKTHRSSQLFLSECESCVSMGVWWSAGCGPVFTHLNVCVKSCETEI